MGRKEGGLKLIAVNMDLPRSHAGARSATGGRLRPGSRSGRRLRLGLGATSLGLLAGARLLTALLGFALLAQLLVGSVGGIQQFLEFFGIQSAKGSKQLLLGERFDGRSQLGSGGIGGLFAGQLSQVLLDLLGLRGDDRAAQCLVGDDVGPHLFAVLLKAIHLGRERHHVELAPLGEGLPDVDDFLDPLRLLALPELIEHDGAIALEVDAGVRQRLLLGLLGGGGGRALSGLGLRFGLRGGSLGLFRSRLIGGPMDNAGLLGITIILTAGAARLGLTISTIKKAHGVTSCKIKLHVDWPARANLASMRTFIVAHLMLFVNSYYTFLGGF